MKKRLHVYFSGRVQGVGFRFTAENIALELGVYGWVKNLSDARVEIVAEASEEILSDFLSRLNKHFSSYVRKADVGWLDASGEFNNFKVEF